MSASNYLENKLLDHITGNAVFTQPTTLYVGIISCTLTDSVMVQGLIENGDTSYEISTVGTGYARVPVTFNPASYQLIPNSGSTYENLSKSNQITFPIPIVAWNDIRFLIITDAAVGGNILYWLPAQLGGGIDRGYTYKTYVFEYCR